MLLLYLRVFTAGSTKIILRHAVIAGMVFTVPLRSITMVLEFHYCTPYIGSNEWNLVLAHNCSHSTLYDVIQGVLNVILDFYIICLPISPILHLYLSLRKRLGNTFDICHCSIARKATLRRASVLEVSAYGAGGLAVSQFAMVFRARFYRTNGILHVRVGGRGVPFGSSWKPRKRKDRMAKT